LPNHLDTSGRVASDLGSYSCQSATRYLVHPPVASMVRVLLHARLYGLDSSGCDASQASNRPLIVWCRVGLQNAGKDTRVNHCAEKADLVRHARVAGGFPSLSCCSFGDATQLSISDPGRAAQWNCYWTNSSISYWPEPVSAARVPPQLQGLRPLFVTLHHFAPPLAPAVLQDAFRQC
jgi:hypothetical protein